MKALVLKEYNRFEYEEVPIPAIMNNDVLIQVKACGICGSDVHGMDGSTGRRIPPLIMGHEASGIIVDTGAEVTQLKNGDWVTFDSTIYCGVCYFCKRGNINLCDNRRVLGVSCDEYRQHGAFAEYVAVPQHIVYPLPDRLSFEHASMVEPLSVAFHAVGRTPKSLNDTAVVVGSGMIGLLTIQALRAAGCGTIIAVDIDKGRLEQAKELGADIGLSSGSDNITAEIRRVTGGRGADIAFEIVGNTPAFKTSLASLHKGGHLTLVGNLSPEIEMSLQSVVTREITMYGSCASCGEYPACLDMMARGAVNVDALISATAPLSEGASWFQRLYDREPGLMKVILKP
ncbi:MAG: galactitol-1-phosphate 5-dehydrogenase [Candidatus Latescibacteria bacterium]|nr:galactitol-1-phosphate 5-dehydrogenase [Candidatus Latescibacterota bacterium]